MPGSQYNGFFVDEVCGFRVCGDVDAAEFIGFVDPQAYELGGGMTGSWWGCFVPSWRPDLRS